MEQTLATDKRRKRRFEMLPERQIFQFESNKINSQLKYSKGIESIAFTILYLQYSEYNPKLLHI